MITGFGYIGNWKSTKWLDTCHFHCLFSMMMMDYERDQSWRKWMKTNTSSKYRAFVRTFIGTLLCKNDFPLHKNEGSWHFFKRRSHAFLQNDHYVRWGNKMKIYSWTIYQWWGGAIWLLVLDILVIENPQNGLKK